jgi:two-component system chemotaxis sensor kinase CheA
VTSLSGRGLGLAIVREKAEKLGGSVAVEARPGVGTCFRIVVPTMLATFQGVIVEVSGRAFVIPMMHVERVARLKPDAVRTVEGRDTIALAGRIVALTLLADALELPAAARNDPMRVGGSVVVVAAGDRRAALMVDAVQGQQEVLVKQLPMPLSRVRNIAGATLLASGELAPILDVGDLLKSAQRVRGAVARMHVEAPQDAAPKTLLVAEDSITSRMLLKGILESAGYRVRTAVDGMEAFTMLRAERFDLVVSDVEMPRLDGFELTARIRADRKLGELPVVLLTALETREDRERGIDVGANAYLVKSSFDQSDLLAAIRRFTG